MLTDILTDRLVFANRLRYPKGKQDITGIYYEPWHYRFVGVYHAKEIKDSGLCLEEYIGQLEGE